MEYERVRKEIELAVLSFAHDYHRFEDIRKDIVLKGIKSHPEFIDQILSLVEIRADNQSLPDIEEIFADVAGLTKKTHKNVLGDKWKYINPIVKSFQGFIRVIPSLKGSE